MQGGMIYKEREPLDLGVEHFSSRIRERKGDSVEDRARLRTFVHK